MPSGTFEDILGVSWRSNRFDYLLWFRYEPTAVVNHSQQALDLRLIVRRGRLSRSLAGSTMVPDAENMSKELEGACADPTLLAF